MPDRPNLGTDTCAVPEPVDSPSLGCHRRRVPDRVVSDLLVNALVFGAGYRWIADERCSATTLRRRRNEWIAAGVMIKREARARTPTTRWSGWSWRTSRWTGAWSRRRAVVRVAGGNPTDRGKLGTKRSVPTDAAGIPLGGVSAPPNRHDSRCSARPWTSSPGSGRCPSGSVSTSTPGTTPRHPRPARRARPDRPDRPQGPGRAGLGHEAVAGGAHPRLAQRLHPSGSLPRTPTCGHRLLRRLGQRRDHHPPAPARSLDHPPLGHPAPPPPMSCRGTLVEQGRLEHAFAQLSWRPSMSFTMISAEFSPRRQGPPTRPLAPLCLG